jgi:hypothetical protein
MSDSLPVSVHLRLEEVCVRFEGAWQAAGAHGVPPFLEDYLRDIMGQERRALLYELLRLDLAYRRQRGDAPTVEEYALRFPGDEEVVRGVFAARPGGDAEEPSPATFRAAGAETMADPDLAAPYQSTGGKGGEDGRAQERFPKVPGYEILEEIGRGGMGVVYKAWQLSLKRPVALKMVLAGGHASPQVLVRFRAEAEAVARLAHPHIVQVFEVGAHDGLPYCALEFVDGGSLEARLKGGPLPPGEAARLVRLLAGAMHLAHSRNIVHRDLKPANVLLGGDDTPKVTDFGLARQLDADGQQTVSGTVMGTPSYMAPEQASGRAHEAGPVADVYALGAILYACLTGRPPFRGATQLETLEQVRNQEPVPPGALQPGVPRDLETICLKCLRKEPEKRYSSARELADDLTRFERGEPVQAHAVGVSERLGKWARRNPAVAGLAGGVGLLLVVGSLVSWGLAAWALEEKGHADEQAGIARTRAGEANASAEQARDQKERAHRDLDLAEFRLYVSMLAQAQQEWQDKNGSKALQLLDDCQWNLRGIEHRLLWTLYNSNQQTLLGGASCLAVSADGHTIVSGGPDGTLRVWDASKRQAVITLKGHRRGVRCVALSADGRRIVSGSDDWTLKVWDTLNTREALPLKGHKGAVSCVALRGRLEIC